MDNFMKFEKIIALTLLLAVGTIAAAQTVDYASPLVLSVTATCGEGEHIKEHWFGLIRQLNMVPHAAVKIGADTTMAVRSTEIIYTGKVSGTYSADIIKAMQRKVSALSTNTACHANWQTSQAVAGS
jgi:hypothetical protein